MLILWLMTIKKYLCQRACESAGQCCCHGDSGTGGGCGGGEWLCIAVVVVGGGVVVVVVFFSDGHSSFVLVPAKMEMFCPGHQPRLKGNGGKLH